MPPGQLDHPRLRRRSYGVGIQSRHCPKVCGSGSGAPLTVHGEHAMWGLDAPKTSLTPVCSSQCTRLRSSGPHPSAGNTIVCADGSLRITVCGTDCTMEKSSRPCWGLYGPAAPARTPRGTLQLRLSVLVTGRVAKQVLPNGALDPQILPLSFTRVRQATFVAEIPRDVLVRGSFSWPTWPPLGVPSASGDGAHFSRM